MPIAFALAAVTFLPGIPLAAVLFQRLRDAVGWIAAAGAIGILWSVLTTCGLALFRIPLTVFSISMMGALPAFIVFLRRPLRRQARETVRGLSIDPASVLVATVTVAILSVPFLTVQHGLPTGDIQKAIYWGSRILETNRLPDYSEALTWNRDPTDFATPGLHTLTAAVMALSGETVRGPAWFALLAAVLLAGLAASLASLLRFQRLRFLPTLAFVFAVSQPRFLRYLTGPGYHYQNLIGELFLLLSFLSLLQAVGGRGRAAFAVLAVISAASLAIVHQFTAFLALFLLPATFAILSFKYRGEIASLIARLQKKYRRMPLLLLLATGAAAGMFLVAGPSAKKFTHFFTDTPHLRSYLVSPEDVPAVLGVPFVLLGSAGILACLLRLRRQDVEWRWSLVVVWTILLFALSQGSRFFIDIPSARTLFYLAVPLSLFAAFAVTSVIERITRLWPNATALLIPTALALSLAPTVGSALNAGLQGIDHSLPANATLTPAMLDTLSFLREHPPACGEYKTNTPSRAGDPQCMDGILVDDWNRRRATWTLLSSYRMLTRVGADIAVISLEAQQSAQRRTQYETLLDFEKIFALGNSPTILPLLEQHQVAYILAATGFSHDVFSQNPVLTNVHQNADVTVFMVNRSAADVAELERDAPRTKDLLAHHTLANDVGDSEDVFDHQPLSLLAPQISSPIDLEGQTLRDIESSVSTIGLNVGTYVRKFWDPDGDRIVDVPIELALEVVANGARGRITYGTKVFAAFDLPDDRTPRTIRARIPPDVLMLSVKGIAGITLRLDRGPLKVNLVSATPSNTPTTAGSALKRWRTTSLIR